MTREEKELLLKDLCERLPYSLYIRVDERGGNKDESVSEGWMGNYLADNRCDDFDADDIMNELADDLIDVWPYLRPMSSMTDDEKKEYESTMVKITPYEESDSVIYVPTIGTFDWLDAHMFDYRELIEQGLALVAPDGIYEIKEK